MKRVGFEGDAENPELSSVLSGMKVSTVPNGRTSRSSSVWYNALGGSVKVNSGVFLSSSHPGLKPLCVLH